MPSWYACGSNSTGVLGLGSTEDVYKPTENILCDKNLRLIVTSGKHAIAIAEDGSLLSAGDNEFGQCSGPTTAPLSSVFRQVALALNVRKVALGWMQTFVLTGEGVLFACGSNAHGQLGLGGSIVQTDALQPVNASHFSGASITDVASGHTHTVALTTEGAAFAWGTCRHGGMGVRDDSGNVVTKTPVPLPILGLPSNTLPLGEQSAAPEAATQPHHSTSGLKYLQVACGWSHTLLLAEPVPGHHSATRPSLVVIAFGSNRHGQCGGNAATGRGTRTAPSMIDMPPGLEPTCIDAGWNHSAALCQHTDSKDDLCLVTWGRSDLGQLGRPPAPPIDASPSPKSTAEDIDIDIKFDAVPAVVPLPAAVLAVSCGSEHTAVTTSDGKAFAFGWNEHGNVGCDARECPVVYAPRQLPLPGTCVAVACGGATTFCGCDVDAA